MQKPVLWNLKISVDLLSKVESGEVDLAGANISVTSATRRNHGFLTADL